MIMAIETPFVAFFSDMSYICPQTLIHLCFPWCFQEEYDAVGKQCRVFSREMLDLCWTSQEVSTLFSNVEGIDKLSTHHAKLRYPRIILGLHFDQDLVGDARKRTWKWTITEYPEFKFRKLSFKPITATHNFKRLKRTYIRRI